MSKLLLAIDLSTAATGFALFDIKTRKLLQQGVIKGKSFKDTSTHRATLRKTEYMATEVLTLIENLKPTHIVIEEISGGGNRISQKTLDIQHGVLWKYIERFLDLVRYMDVTGLHGWRTFLGLKQSEQDKLHNKIAKKTNKLVGRGQKLPIIGTKHLSCRYVNANYNLNLDPDQNETDGDIADAIGLGSAYLQKVLTS
jgi:Holliday junction resolvasome RuvABC endonuclease subunit